MILATPLAMVNLQTCYALQAMGKGRESLIAAVCRQELFHIPLLFLMQFLFGLNGLVWAQFAADAVALPVSFLIYGRVKKKLEKLSFER